MGSRERRFHKQQQKQQSIGQGYTGERRVSLPPPISANERDPVQNLPPQDARRILNAIPDEDGLLILRDPHPSVGTSAGGGASFTKSLITYNASGTTSAECWLFDQAKIYNVGERLDGGYTFVTASAISAPSASANWAYDHTVFNHTVICVNSRDTPLKWTRASGWGPWSATASGGAVQNFYGINSFKNRLFGWEYDSPVFWYGSTDQVLGTFNSFDLGNIVSGNIRMMDSITRDGGAGPDDYAIFITDSGDAAVYQGTDPGDANSWSLVGRYKIGKPVSRNSKIKYGQQLVVLCEDDFYFLPNDLQGKRQATKYARKMGADSGNGDRVNAVYWEAERKLVFSDGTVLDPERGYSATEIYLSSADPVDIRDIRFLSARPILGVHNGELISAIVKSDQDAEVWRINAITETTGQAFGGNHKATIVTGAIPSTGRTNVSLVNPRFAIRTGVNTSTTASAAHNIRYRTAIVHDNHYSIRASASANAWVTTSASSNSFDKWTPGFGDGHVAQVHLQVISASTSAELILTGIDFTFSDTGGI